jgi:hypothetical protein
MTPAKLFLHLYAWAALAATVVGLAWMLISPPPSMRLDHDGVPHFTPAVLHPVTGEGISVAELIRHYRGD